MGASRDVTMIMTQTYHSDGTRKLALKKASEMTLCHVNCADMNLGTPLKMLICASTQTSSHKTRK